MKNDYEKLKNLSADIYNMASLLTEFCSREEYNEKIANILPVLKYFHNKAEIKLHVYKQRSLIQNRIKLLCQI